MESDFQIRKESCSVYTSQGLATLHPRHCHTRITKPLRATPVPAQTSVPHLPWDAQAALRHRCCTHTHARVHTHTRT